MDYIQSIFFDIEGTLKFQCLRYQELTVYDLTDMAVVVAAV